MADIYNSNAVPHSFPGGICTISGSGGSDLGEFVVESFTPQYPVHKVERPNEVSGDGGWALTAPTHATASITVQVPKSDTTIPPSGSYIEGDFGNGEERWVFGQVSKQFNAGDYWKVTYEAHLDRFVEEEEEGQT